MEVSVSLTEYRKIKELYLSLKNEEVHVSEEEVIERLGSFLEAIEKLDKVCVLCKSY